MRKGEIFPTNTAPILLLDDHGRVLPDFARWGLAGEKGASLPAAELPGEGALCRCAIPTDGFFGWGVGKEKFLFTGAGGGLLYLGGVYREGEAEREFAILTLPCGMEYGELHGQQPLTIPPERLRAWLTEEEMAEKLLTTPPPPLRRRVAD